ncbi:hypothetical protein B0H11DRAFT_1710480 [Mycena galericulata]|nr:hypothetical protein B0H11DRAFT_1710480 [Mycena galericulata]
MKFITRVYHPNVSSATGAICLDILKDAWTPVLTLKSTLISVHDPVRKSMDDKPPTARPKYIIMHRCAVCAASVQSRL